jgi:hypothetical protein
MYRASFAEEVGVPLDVLNRAATHSPKEQRRVALFSYDSSGPSCPTCNRLMIKPYLGVYGDHWSYCNSCREPHKVEGE